MSIASLGRAVDTTARELAEQFLGLALRLEPRFVLPPDHTEAETLTQAVRQAIGAAEALLRGDPVEPYEGPNAHKARDVATELGNLEAADAALAAYMARYFAEWIDKPWFSGDGGVKAWKAKSHGTEGL